MLNGGIQRLKAVVELGIWFAAVAHMFAVSGVHTTALIRITICITIHIGIHLTQLQTSKIHLNQLLGE